MKNKYELELITKEDIRQEGQLFEYKGKVLLVSQKMFENYEKGIIKNLPFVYDISCDLKWQVINQEKTCEEAIDQLGYVAAEKIEDKKFIIDFQESLVARNKEGLAKFHDYLARENDSDFSEMTLPDISNGLFYNGLGQGFKPKSLRNLDKNYVQSSTIDDLFMYD